ncbi:MAG: hypothetical protein ACYTG1_01410 [Planctomycetota bacterium]|jgi:hypothetical protein
MATMTLAAPRCRSRSGRGSSDSTTGWKPAPPRPPHGPRARPPVRTGKIKRLRAEIAAGRYLTPRRWRIAVDRLLADAAAREGAAADG